VFRRDYFIDSWPVAEHHTYGVGIPRGFTREFIEEAEANLARDSDRGKFELETKFSSLNPQKQE